MFRRSATQCARIALAAAAFLPLGAAARRASSFSKDQERSAQEQAATEAARQERIASNLSTPCRAELKGKKIMVIIGELQSNGYVAAQQQNYGPHFQAINARLRSLGLRDLHAGGDPRADRAGRDRRLLQERSRRRAVRGEAPRRELRAARPDHVAGDAATRSCAVNQVSVSMGFTLTGGNGRIISDAGASSALLRGRRRVARWR